MTHANHSIEKNIKLVGLVGLTLFVTLIASLVFVQVRLGRSQEKLTGSVVPTQRELGALKGSIGSMFRRQSDIISADQSSLAAMEDRSHYEDSIIHHRKSLSDLLASLQAEDAYPHMASDSLERDARAFLDADQQLFDTVRECRDTQAKFSDCVREVDHDMRTLIEASGGVAGILRLQYMSLLRQIANQFNQDEIDQELIRQSVTGDARVQLAAMNDLDAAVLHLGVLAGKVGIVSNRDELNSLVANEIKQNQNHILRTIGRIEKTVTNEAAIDRVASLKVLAAALTAKVGDESLPNSLTSLRRRVLTKEQRVREIQDTTALAAKKLDGHTESMRSFADSVAAKAGESAQSTVSGSRTLTAIVSLIGLGLACVAGARVRQSVLALRKQNETLQKLSDDLAKSNENLEQIVADRTASLQMVLDSTGEGLLSVDLNGCLLPERSQATTAWFGNAANDVLLWDYLAPHDNRTNDLISMAYEQLAEDILPFEVSASLIPNSFVRDGKTFSIDCREVTEGGRLSKVLLLVNDITAQIAAEKKRTPSTRVASAHWSDPARPNRFPNHGRRMH